MDPMGNIVLGMIHLLPDPTMGEISAVWVFGLAWAKSNTSTDKKTL